MKTFTKIAATAFIAATAAVSLTACSSESDTVSYNLSKDADNYKIHRLIVFHNDISDTNLFSIEGLCSLGNDDTDTKRTVTCKIASGDGSDSYVKEIFQMGDNTSVMSVQTEASKVDPYHYEVIFRPETIIPDIQTKTSK